MDQDTYPILWQPRREKEKFPDFPTTIPWGLVEEYRAQIEHNHSQSIERLAERGGLSVEEIYLASKGHDIFDIPFPSQDECVKHITHLLNKFSEETPR